MEESRNKRMIVKFGGGGIGAVVLLGGVLATAAVATAFVGRRNGRSSGKDGRRRHQNSPPEKNNHSEKDEAKSEGGKKEVESDNESAVLVSTQSLTLDEKASVGETPGDVEAIDLVSPRKLENGTVSDDSFVVVEGDFPSLDEKLQLESQNKVLEDEKTSAKEDVSHDSKQNKNVEQVYNEEEMAEREHNEDGDIGVEVTEMQPRQEEKAAVVDKDVEGVHVDKMEAEMNVNMEPNMEKINCEAFEGAKVDLSEGICTNEEAIGVDSSLSEIVVSENCGENGGKSIEHEIVDGDEKGVLRDKAMVTFQEDEVKYIEEDRLVNEERDDNTFIPCEENGCMVHPTPENILPILKEMNAPEPEVAKDDRANEEVGESEEVYENMIEKEVEEKVILPEDGKNTKDGVNDEVSESLEVNENGNSMQFPVYQTKDDIDDLVGNAEKEVEEVVFSHKNAGATKSTVNEEVLELNEKEKLVYEIKDNVDDVERNDEKEVEEEVVVHENVEARNYIANEEVLELNENGMLVYQIKDDIDDVERNDEKEAEKEVISHENVEARKDIANEEVVELNENGMLVHQMKDDIDDVERNDETEAEEEVISHENIEATKDIANEEVVELNENRALVHQMKDGIDVERNDEKEVEEEAILHENIEATNVNEDVLELNENGMLIYQINDNVDDDERNSEKEVEEEVISDENIEATKDIVNEEVLELNENGKLVYQVKDVVVDVERNAENEVEEKKVISHENIVNEEDSESAEVEFVVGQPTENEHDFEGNVEDSSDADKTNDESSLSDETQESSVGGTESNESSSELNSEAVLSSESPEELSIEPQQVKLTSYEIEGKIQEDKTEKEGEMISKESSLQPHQVRANSDKTFINKYMVDLAMLKYHKRSMRRRMIIVMLSLISSYSCSWYFGLSFVKLCLVVFFTVAVSEILGY